MKKIISLVLGLGVLVGTNTVLFAKNTTNTPVFINGEMRTYGFIEKGITHIPVRTVSETLGATVDWSKETGTVTVLKDSNKAIVNQPKIINNTTYVPLRFVSENLGAAVDWNSKTRRVEITADFVKPVEINTIESLNLTSHKIADYPTISKSDITYRYRNPETNTITLKEDVVFITKDQLPLKFGDTIIYDFNLKGNIFTMEQQRLKGDNSAMIVGLAVKNEGIRRSRNDNFSTPTVKLPNGRILATYDEISLADSLKFDNYKSFKWEQVEYFILYSSDISELIALKNPLSK